MRSKRAMKPIAAFGYSARIRSRISGSERRATRSASGYWASVLNVEQRWKGFTERLEAEQNADAPRRHLRPHLESLRVGLGDGVENVAEHLGVIALRQRHRQRPAGGEHHLAKRRQLVLRVDEVGDHLQHAGVGGADLTGDANELIARRGQSWCRLAPARAVVESSRCREAERTRPHRLSGEASHFGDLGG